MQCRVISHSVPHAMLPRLRSRAPVPQTPRSRRVPVALGGCPGSGGPRTLQQWMCRRGPTGAESSTAASPSAILLCRLGRVQRKFGREHDRTCARVSVGACNRHGAVPAPPALPGVWPSQAPAATRGYCSRCRKCAASMRARSSRQPPPAWIPCSSRAWSVGDPCRSSHLGFVSLVCDFWILGLGATVVIVGGGVADAPV